MFGENKAKGGLTEKTVDELVDELMKVHNLEHWLSPMSEEDIEKRRKTFGAPDRDDIPCETALPSSTENFFTHFPKNLEHYITDDFRETLHGYDRRKMQYVESCPECNRKYTDPSPADLVMYLHCYKYKGDDFEYTAGWPNWASEDWTID